MSEYNNTNPHGADYPADGGTGKGTGYPGGGTYGSNEPYDLVLYQPGDVLISFSIIGKPDIFQALPNKENALRAGLQERLDKAVRADEDKKRITIAVQTITAFNLRDRQGSPAPIFTAKISVTPPEQTLTAAHRLSPQKSDAAYGSTYTVDLAGADIKARVSGAGPNWLIATSSGAGTTGGPGSSPVPMPAGTARADFDRRSYPEPFGTGRVAPKDVPIYVLDTTPTASPSLAGAQEAANGNAQIAQNGAIQRLLLDNPPVLSFVETAYLSDPEEKAITVPTCILGDQSHLPVTPNFCDESDHGLFVAGIIEALTDTPKIGIAQVLGRYGVGDVHAALQALSDIAEAEANRGRDKQGNLIPVLVNMSLMLALPDLARVRRGDFGLFDPEHTRTWGADERAWLQEWAGRRADALPDDQDGPDAPIMRVLLRLVEEQIFVVAAAGNDSDAGNHHPPRFPAAYPFVFSAASINREARPSNFSNRGDTGETPTHGVAVFGGQTRAGDDCDPIRVPTEGWVSTGVNDVFLIDPSTDSHITKHNTSGWLMWAGTSFSTPALTAWLARNIQTRLDTGDSTGLHDVLRGLQTVASRVPGDGTLGVNYLLVEQRYSRTADAVQYDAPGEDE